MNRLLILTSAIALCGCGPWEALFDTTIPSYQPPESDMRSMDPDSTPDPKLRIPQNLTATSAEEGVRLEWFPVKDAEFFEVQIEGGAWQRASKETTFIDTNAPFGAVTDATLTATQGDTRAGVRLAITNVTTAPGASQRYKVRAVFTDGAGDPSDEVTGQRSATTPTQRWEYKTPEDTWAEIPNATDAELLDDTAPLDGTPRTYRAHLQQGAGESFSVETSGMRMAVVKLASGYAHTCALFSSKKVKCWGLNNAGQLGLGDALNRGHLPYTEPLKFASFPEPIQDIYASFKSTCGLGESNKLYCWGNVLKDRDFGDEPNEEPFEIQLDGKPQKLWVSDDFHRNPGEFRLLVWFDNGSLEYWSNTENSTDKKSFFPNKTITDVNLSETYHNVLFDDDTIAHRQITERWQENQPWRNEPWITFDAPQNPTYWSDSRWTSTACIISEPDPSFNGSDTQTHCIGSNFSYVLGDPDMSKKIEPSEGFTLPPVSTTVEIATFNAQTVVLGLYSGCSLSKNQFISCWGQSDSGELGQGNTNICGDELQDQDCGRMLLEQKTKQLVSGLSSYCALSFAGTVLCWGATSAYGHTNNLGDEPGEMPPPEVPLWDTLPQ